MFRIVIIAALLLIGAGVFFYFRHTMPRFCRAWGIGSKAGRVLRIMVPILAAAALAGAFSLAGILYLHFILLWILTELAVLLIKKLSKKPCKKLLRGVYSAVPALLLTAVVGLYGYGNMRHIVRTDYTVETGKALQKDYTVVLMADIHYGNAVDSEKLQSLCEEVNVLAPDVLLLGGDMADESTTAGELTELFTLLDGVESTYGTYYVSGNHDKGSYRRSGAGNAIETVLASTRIRYLQDESVPLGEDLLLVGRRDASEKERLPVSDLLSAADNERFILVLDHQPREYAESAAAGVDLQLSGHTHAGQVFPAGLLTEPFGSELNYGLKAIGSFRAIVTSGVSGWGFPFRTEKHSEYVVIHIQPEGGANG